MLPMATPTTPSGTDKIVIPADDNTLQQAAGYINSSNYGVTANVVTDAQGSRLVLVSKTSGAAGNLTVTSSALNFNQGTAGVDAQLNVDGVPIDSPTNTVTTALPGVTLNLASASPNTPVTISVAADTSQATQTINSFVSAYNTVINDINSQFTLDANAQEGPLAGNSGLRSLQSQLLSAVSYSVSGTGQYVNLQSMGIEMQDDGTLQVNSQVFNDAISNHYQDFQNFFQSLTPQGFGNFFGTQMMQMTDPTQGPIALAVTGLQQTNQSLTNDINNFEARMTSLQQQLTQQYSAVNATLEEYPLLMQQISSQLGSLSSSTRAASRHEKYPRSQAGLPGKCGARRHSHRAGGHPVRCRHRRYAACGIRRSRPATSRSGRPPSVTPCWSCNNCKARSTSKRAGWSPGSSSSSTTWFGPKLLESQLRNSPELMQQQIALHVGRPRLLGGSGKATEAQAHRAGCDASAGVTDWSRGRRSYSRMECVDDSTSLELLRRANACFRRFFDRFSGARRGGRRRGASCAAAVARGAGIGEALCSMDACKAQPTATFARPWAAIARTLSGCGANWPRCRNPRWPAAPAWIPAGNTFMPPKPGAPPRAPSADPLRTQHFSCRWKAGACAPAFGFVRDLGERSIVWLEQLATQYASQA